MTTPYTTGSITLTNGSAVVVGIGTAWQTALIAGGTLYVEADGNPLPILTVDSNTQITAAIKWKGASGTYPYAIMRDTAYGQQTVANAQALSTYLQRLDNASLAALASLAASMSADKFAYATGLNSMAWAALSAFGREMLALGDGAAVRGKIGAFSAGGGTINGSMTVTGAFGANGAVQAGGGLFSDGAAGSTSLTHYRTGTALRWVTGRTSTAETGGNAGSNFTVDRFNDAASYLGSSFVINRKTGAAHFPETPFCQTNLGADIVINPGINTGISVAGFTFNRGGFITGGDLNTRNVVHFPIAGWYRCSFTAAANSPDGAATLELVLNGSNVPAHIGTIGATFNVINNTVMLLVNANDYLNMRALGGRIFFAGWNSRCILEFIQPI